MFDIGIPELILIVLAFGILFFGGKKISEFARGLGRFTGEFKKGKKDIENEIKMGEEEIRTAVKPIETKAETLANFKSKK